MIKEKWKIATIESIPYFIVMIVIALAIWINALIVQDSISLKVATILGLVLVFVVVCLEIISLILLKAREIEIKVKDKMIEEKDQMIEELENELERIKNS